MSFEMILGDSQIISLPPEFERLDYYEVEKIYRT